MARTWAVTDHLCGACGGRILRCVFGNGATGGGNPIYMCADCERATAAMGPDVLCWCGKTYRNGSNMGYRCIRVDDPRFDTFQWARYGVDPRHHRIGVVLEADLVDFLQPKE